MRKLAFALIILLTGCLGDKIPWDIATVKQSSGVLCVYASDINKNFIFKHIKIQKAGEEKEFTTDITGQKYAKDKCLPMMGYEFITGKEYNVSFSIVDLNSGKTKIYATRFIYKPSTNN